MSNSAMDPRLQRADAALSKGDALIKDEANQATRNRKQTRERVRKILNGIQQVTAVVEGVGELHPVAKAVVTVFKAVIKLEVNRRENSEQVAAVCQAMTSMFYALRHLHGFMAPGEELNEQLEQEMSGMTDAINEFGDFTDLYYNRCKSRVVRFLRASDFRDKLTGFAGAFLAHQQRVEFVLAVRAGAQQARTRADVQAAVANTERIIARLGAPEGPKEVKAAGVVAQHGGPAGVINDQAAVQQVAQLLDDSVTASTLSALREDLGRLLEDNWGQFQLKLDGATMEINDAIGRSTETILLKLNSGPHDLIDDPDVKEIWKVSEWKLSVKSRYFVDALCNHFSTKFLRAAADSEGHPPPDTWTLKVLEKVINHPAIGEAVDEDASGFMSIHELNHFIGRKPADASTPLWFAYWALGWRYLNVQYTIAIETIIDNIEAKCKKVKASLRSPAQTGLGDIIDGYLVTTGLWRVMLAWLGIVAEGPGSIFADVDEQTSSELERVALELSERDEAMLKENLHRIQYYLNDAALLPSITGQSNVRIEQVILVMLYVILLEQQDEIPDEQTVASDYEEYAAKWESMDITLSTLVFQFHGRMRSLIRSWRSQKVDVELQVQCYAGGLFTGWYDEYTRTGSQIKKLLENSDDDDEEEEESAPAPDDSANDKIAQLTARVDGLDTRLQSIESMLKQLLSISAPSGGGGAARALAPAAQASPRGIPPPFGREIEREAEGREEAEHEREPEDDGNYEQGGADQEESGAGGYDEEGEEQFGRGGDEEEEPRDDDDEPQGNGEHAGEDDD